MSQRALSTEQFKQRESGRPLPITVLKGPLYHGTTPEAAEAIERDGFRSDKAAERQHGAVFLTPHRELAEQFGPSVLHVDEIRGVSAHEVGYLHHDKARAAGADYMDHGPEIAVLNPSAIRGIRRA
jgi:hypothetical protein